MANTHLKPGTDVLFIGRVWTVAGIDGPRVKLRLPSTSETLDVDISELAVDATFAVLDESAHLDTKAIMDDILGLAALDPAQMRWIIRLARHLEEVNRGVPALPDEDPPFAKPRAAFHPDQPRRSRIMAKVEELRNTEFECSYRTLQRRLAAYAQHGMVGLLPRTVVAPRPRGRSVDPKYVALLVEAMSRDADGVERSQTYILDSIEHLIAEDESLKDVEVPSRSTQVRVFRDVARRLGWRKGRRKYVSSHFNRPDRTYLSVRPVLPGERMEFDSTTANILVKNPLTGRVYRPEISAMIDVATRLVPGLLVGATTDHALVMRVVREVMVPKPPMPMMALKSHVNALGLPPGLLLDAYPHLSPEAELSSGVMMKPHTVVVDQGKAYYNNQTQMMFARVGIALELARPGTPTDKPHIERFFATLETLLERLPGYVGRDVAARGSTRIDRSALLTESELETLILAWLALEYHPSPHSSLHVPVSSGGVAVVSPFDMYRILINQHGFIPAPLDASLRYAMMDVEHRVIGDDGIRIDHLVYDHPLLNHLRQATCPWTGTRTWPIHVDPLDCRSVFIRVPEGTDYSWLEVPWKHQPSELKFPFPRKVMEFARTHDVVVGAEGLPVAWEPRASRSRSTEGTEESKLAADSTLSFMDWFLNYLGHRDEGLEWGTTDEERALRGLVDAMHQTHRQKMQERYFVVDDGPELSGDGSRGGEYDVEREIATLDEELTSHGEDSDTDYDDFDGWRF